MVVGVLPRSLTNFRGDLIKDLVRAGHKVTAMSAPADEDQIQCIEALGANFRSYPVQQTGLNPLSDVATFFALQKIFSEIKPDIVFTYTIKPNIWGAFAAMMFPTIKLYTLVEGAGFVFQKVNFFRTLIRAVVIILYKSALHNSCKVLFLNQDNKELFIKKRMVLESKTAVIPGIGVSLEHYKFILIPSGDIPVFLLIARLLNEKGIREYVQAAKQVKKAYPDVLFNLLGPSTSHQDGIPLIEVESWNNDGIIQYMGKTLDVRPFIADCHVYVLPSYHEGMPRTVLEAMAMGRPIITTDAPGCRETVEDGRNGYLIPIKNPAALVKAMERFINDPKLAKKMGKESRKIAEYKYDVHKVNKVIMEAMGLS